LLARELDRPTNILRWQPDGAAPMFLRTKRSPIDEISSEIPPIHTLKVPILCEPFAVGPKEVLAPVVVSNDPSTGCNFNVDYPKGDVETPLYLSFVAGDVIAAGQKQTAIATRRRGTPGAAPWILAAQTMNRAGGGTTTLPGNDPLMSGSGSNYVRMASLTTTPTTRLTSAVFPASSGVDVRGKYRCYVRYRKSSAVADLRLQLLVSGDGTNTITVGEGLVVLDDTTAIRWADMGTVQLPLGDDPGQDGLSGVDLACGGLIWMVQAVNFSGSSPTLDVDCIVLMYADDRFCRITWPSVAGPTSMVLDSASKPRPQVYALGASGETMSTQLRALDGGGTPLVSPNAYNRLRILNTGMETASDSIASSMTVTPYYWPRYVFLRPPTT
jgi:hypothetical protein